jgi:hypothetical protein
MKKIFTTIALITSLGLVAACPIEVEPKPKADVVQARATEQAAQQANRSVGMPAITNWTEKRDVKWLYELRDKAEYATYTYTTNMNGDRIFLCDSIGMGINASIQFSNPERVVANSTFANGGSIFGSIPQMEPNGLFMPEGLSATYVKCVNPETDEVSAVYVEDNIIVSPFKLH